MSSAVHDGSTWSGRDTGSSPWLVRRAPRQDARARVLAFPYAGGGASAYYEWPALLPPDIELVAVQLPGREERLGEEPINDLRVLGPRLLDAVCGILDLPTVLFGHSMGALVAYDLAQRLAREGLPGPVHLVASACRAPHLREAWGDPSGMTDEEVVALMRSLDGTPTEVFEHPELLEMVLPIIRADLAMIVRYEAFSPTPLTCPVTAIGGTYDRDVSAADLGAWAAHTTGPFDLDLFDGGHFFLREHAATVATRIAATVEATGE